MPNPARSSHIALILFLLTAAASGYAATSPPAYVEVLSFDMWCLEMRFYPPQRCDARRVDDVKAYEQYRVAVERYDQEREAREKRDQQIQERLNRDTAGTQQGAPGK